MPMVRITFHKLIQDSQEYGSDDEHMVSRAFFTLEVDGKGHEELSADIKQPVGSDFEATPLEVSLPSSYKGPLGHEAFRKEVEEYYREAVGRRGHSIHIEGGANIRMQNNTFVAEKKVSLRVGSKDMGW